MNTKFIDRDFRILVNCLTTKENNLKGAGDVILVVDGYEESPVTHCVEIYSESLGGRTLLPVLAEIFDASAQLFIINELRKNPTAVMDARSGALRNASHAYIPMPLVTVSDGTPVATKDNVFVDWPDVRPT